MSRDTLWPRRTLYFQAVLASYDTIVRNTFLNLVVEELFYYIATAFMKLCLLSLHWHIFNVASI